MKRQKNHKTAKLIEALEFIDVRYIEEAGAKIKERPTFGVYYAANNRKKTLRQIIALAACIALLVAAVPLATYLSTHLPDFIASIRGDQTTETDPELTHPETPPEETTVPAPDTTEDTTAFEHETTEEPWPSTTAPHEETTSPEETTAEETTEEATTAPPEPEYDGSRGLEYKVSDDGKTASLVGIGTCTDKDIVVASTYNGLPVTFIDYSFSEISNVTSITLSDSVLTVVGIYRMPDLVRVYFSKSFEGINPESLRGCPNLEVIEVDKNNETHMSVGNCLIQKATKTLVHGCKGSIIPSDGSVTIIGEFSFHGCEWLTELTIPKNIERIDAYAFAGCDNLKKVILPDSLTYLGYGSFFSCESLESVTFGKNLETVGGAVFENCPKLKELNFPKTLKYLGSLALDRCESLKKVSFAGTVEEWNAIEKTWMWHGGAPLFSVIHCSDGDVDLIEYDGSRGLEYKVNADGKTASLVGIGTCTDKDIVVASTYNGLPVTQIWYNAFNGNTQIVSVTISNGVTYIDKRAFANCTSLESIIIPSSVKSFGECETFVNCTSLKTIVLPDGMNYLGVETFKGCTSLESIVMEGVGSIDTSAFEDCTKLNNIVISGKCIEISYSAFKNCRSLTKFSFSGTVNEWMKLAKGNEWNEGCAFTEVRCLDGNANSYLTPEYDGSQGLEYEIKLFNGDQYAVLVGIGTCTDKDIVVATKYNGSPVTEINSFALYNRQFIESIVIPEGVTNIGEEAFYLCKNLKKVTLPSTLEYIRYWAFANCESLESIRIPADVKWIGQRAFSDCKKLEWLTLSEGLEQIQENAFYNCSLLKSVKFPRSLKLIAAAAFNGCTQLSSIMYSGSVGEWSEVDSTGKDYYYQSFTWHDGVPAEKIRCSDGDVYLYNLSEAEAIEAARKFWNLSSDAVLFIKEKSPAYPYCYKIAYCEPNPIEVLFDNFVVKREVFVDQRTGECTEVVYDYPNIPDVFLDVIFNREKFLYVEQTASSNGEYKYTTSEALFKDLSVHHDYVFGSQTLWYYVTDIDGDSIPELIFPGSARLNYGMLFRVYEGKIYGYACILDGLHTDATYFWHEQAGNYRGRSQIYFDGIFYKSRRLTEYDINDPNNIIYYVEGKETTKEKYEEFESAFSNEELESFRLDYYPLYVNPFPGG